MVNISFAYLISIFNILCCLENLLLYFELVSYNATLIFCQLIVTDSAFNPLSK